MVTGSDGLWFISLPGCFGQVLSVDQWGVDVSLLPSLAASDPGSPLDLQPSEEPAVLELVSLSGAGTGKSSLQAATPLDFMSYLYAR